MSGRDVRPRLIAAVIADPDLSYRDKLYLLTVATVTAEYVDGKKRYGSRGMDASGRYALNVDYIARCMGKGLYAVREARIALEAARWIDRVHESTHARPATYQALLAGTACAPLREGFLHGLRGSENLEPKEASTAPQGFGKPGALPIERPATSITQPRRASHQSAAGDKRSNEEREPLEESVDLAIGDGSPCPHGMPDGDLPDPWVGGRIACPACALNVDNRKKEKDV